MLVFLLMPADIPEEVRLPPKPIVQSVIVEVSKSPPAFPLMEHVAYVIVEEAAAHNKLFSTLISLI